MPDALQNFNYNSISVKEFNSPDTVPDNPKLLRGILDHYILPPATKSRKSANSNL